LRCGLRLEDRAEPNDAIVDFGTVKIYIDPKSAPLVEGAVLDFVEELEASGFRFTNLRGKKN
jgi:iron-sulfur cluster assembly accessory protein